MRKLAFTLMLAACSLAFAGATVYKWVDEDGVVHYSDQPHPNAQKVQVQSAQTYPASAPNPAAYARNAGSPNDSAAPGNANAYQGCAIVQPGDQQNFANLDSLNIVVQTDPPLHAGDQIFVTLDGQPLNGGAPTGAQFTVSPIDRGDHTLQATVRDAQGNVLCQAPGVTFSVHQPSVLNPANQVPRH
jgi:hypothetical protein